jgi:hypothetical protein
MNFLIFLLTVFLVLPMHAADKTKPFGQLQHEQKYKDYTIRIYWSETSESDDYGCYEILKSGKQVYFQKGFKFEVGNPGNGDITNKLIEMGRSITSEKQPNLVVWQWTGGAHCCYAFDIFQIGDTFKLIDHLETGHGIDSDFKDLRGDGNLELVTYDWAFAYWHTTFVDSPAPTVILRYRNHKYRPDLELMHKPAPTEHQLQRMAEELKSKFAHAGKFIDDDKWAAPPSLWGKMLDLIYSGNMDSARKLWNLSWPKNHPNKKLFWRDFIKELQDSPYYKDINEPGFQKGVANDKK